MVSFNQFHNRFLNVGKCIVLGEEPLDFFVFEAYFFFLIGFFLAHNALNDGLGKHPITVELMKPECLRVGRRAVVHFTLLQYIVLRLFVQI